MGLVKFLRRKLRRQRAAAAVDNIEKDDTIATYTFCKSNPVRMPPRQPWNEIQKLTRDFATVIGYGGFSTVYLAQFRDSSTAAVKIYCTTNSQRLYEAFKQELDILIRLQHPNIVKLIAYSDDQDGALILEHVSNGNLQEKLHSYDTVLTWKQRMWIAFQLAQAIAYLHEVCSPHIVHGDIKPSNILLNENLSCKLCDFGSAKMGFSSTVARKQRTMMMTGSPGYTDPLYLRTGLASKKNDVYGFGVLVLELLTGIEAFDPDSGERLTVRAEPMLRNTDKGAEMVDQRLCGRVDLEEARAMAALAAKCISESPGVRPSASHILTTMCEIF